MNNTLLLFAAAAVLAACDADIAAPAIDDRGAEIAATVATVIEGEPSGPIYTRNAGETLALSGYDAVAYFGEAGPTKGSPDHKVTYQGYDYQFASAENAATFAADPEKYAPQYGGYCAWAIGANDALAPGDPEVYKIVDGKLYLNFSPDVAKKWNENIAGFIAKADVNYPAHDASEHYTTN